MRTNTAIIGLVLAVLVIAGGVYAYSSLGSEKETISVHYEFIEDFDSGYWHGKAVVGARCEITWTSSTGEPIYVTEHLDLVLQDQKTEKILHASISPEYIDSGKTVPWLLYYDTLTSEPMDLTGWSYHFELTEKMKKAGNYKIIEE